MVGLEVGGLERDVGVGGGVALVEAVARELLHEVEQLGGHVGRHAVATRALDEDAAVLGHLLGLLLAHRAAQQIGAAQRVASDGLRDAHDLLLVDHDAVGLAEDLLEARVEVLDLLTPVLALDVVGDQVHGPRTVERIQGDQVLEPVGLGALEQLAHAARFELEDGRRVGALEDLVALGVVERQVVEVDLQPGIQAPHVLERDRQDGERGQAQEVELDQADGLDIVLVELADHRVGRTARRIKRAEVGELARRDQHPARMHADVARQALERACQLDELTVLLVGLHRLAKRGLVLERAVQRPGVGRVVRDQLRELVALGVGHVEHAAGVAHHGLRAQGAEGGDLAHGLGAVLALDVVDHAVALVLAEVDVEVGHRHALGVQEALEQQVVVQRVEVGDAQAVGHQRARARAAPRTHRDTVVLGPVDEVRDDQEVAREAHLGDGREFEIEPRGVARAGLVARRGLGVERGQAPLQPGQRQLARIVVEAHALGRGKERQLRLAKHELEVAAARDLNGIGQRHRHVGEELGHLRAGLEVLLRGVVPGAARVGQGVALGDAHARLVRGVVAGREKLDRVRGHHRQLEFDRQRQGGTAGGLVAWTASALELEVVAPGEDRGQALRGRQRGLASASGEMHADRAFARPRQGD